MAKNYKVVGILILMLIFTMIFKYFHNSQISHNQKKPSEIADYNRKHAIIDDSLTYLFEIEMFTQNFESKKRILTTDTEKENDLIKLNEYLKDLYILKEVFKGNEIATKRVMHNINYIKINLEKYSRARRSPHDKIPDK